MNYKLLGKSGLRVSELCLGTMTFGEDWGWGASKDECERMLNAFVDAGGNFIDTANHYTNGTSEKIVGELLAGKRDEFVIATKYTLNGRPNDPNAGGNQRKSMVQAVNASLKRLNTDYIDLYWVHAWDGITPIDEVMRGLDDLIHAGKILYIGISDAPAWKVAQANTLAELRGWSQFVGLQIQYNLVERTSERDLLPMAHEFGISVTAWSPLAGGVLSGKYNTNDSNQYRFGDHNPRSKALLTERNLKIAEKLMAVAGEIGKTPSQVALRWLLQKGKNIIPIIGAKKSSQIADNLGCLSFELSEPHMNVLNEISKIELGFPHDFLNTPMVKQLVHGNNHSKLKL